MRLDFFEKVALSYTQIFDALSEFEAKLDKKHVFWTIFAKSKNSVFTKFS